MSDVETYEELDAMLTGISSSRWSSFGLATSPVGCESNCSILLCTSSYKLDKTLSVQPQVDGIPFNRRKAIVSARSDVCVLSNSTWFDMFIESTFMRNEHS